MRDDIERFEERGAVVLCIAPQGVEDARAIKLELNLPFPVLADGDRAVFDSYAVHSRLLSLGQRPGLYVLDGEGRICFAHVRTQQWDIPPNAKVLACRDTVCREPAGVG